MVVSGRVNDKIHVLLVTSYDLGDEVGSETMASSSERERTLEVKPQPRVSQLVTLKQTHGYNTGTNSADYSSLGPSGQIHPFERLSDSGETSSFISRHYRSWAGTGCADLRCKLSLELPVTPRTTSLW